MLTADSAHSSSSSMGAGHGNNVIIIAFLTMQIIIIMDFQSGSRAQVLTLRPLGLGRWAACLPPLEKKAIKRMGSIHCVTALAASQLLAWPADLTTPRGLGCYRRRGLAPPL